MDSATFDQVCEVNHLNSRDLLVVSDFREGFALADTRDMLAELVEYRELLYQMTLRDLLVRYKQTAMGFGWAIFMPLINTAVFSVIFTRVTRIETPVAYPLFAYSGFLVWNFFASSLRFSVASLTSNSSLVQKVYFPREIFPFSAVLVCLVDLLVGSLVLVALMAYYRTPVSLTLLWVPAIVAVNLAFTAGVSLFLAMSNLFYRDVKYLFEVVITVWMFATSVIYPVGSVGGRLGMLLMANPMTQIVEAYRSAILYGRPPDPVGFGVTAVVSFAVMFACWSFFHKAEFAFAENI
jgi:lipopolysaccharide transport system permease protein